MKIAAKPLTQRRKAAGEIAFGLLRAAFIAAGAIPYVSLIA
jgi:hypothetical protein